MSSFADARSSMGTDFTQMLKVNYAPTATERLHIQAVVSAKQAHLAQIENEIDRLLSLLDPLLRARDLAQKSLSEHTSLLSPARRVPPEIWSDIFTRCLPDAAHVTIDYAHAPLLFMQICRHWRSIALSTPRLWTYLTVRARNEAIPEPSSLLVKEWLSRAGSLPLSIKVEATVSLSPNLVDTLASFRSQIHSLDVLAQDQERQKLFDGDMANLASLSIRSSGIAHSFPLPNAMPNLRRLVVPGIEQSSTMPFSWADLTALDVTDSIEFNQCFPIFHQCRSLSRLALHRIDGTHDATYRACATLPHLRFLQLSPNRDVGILLDHLTLPNLRQANVAELHSAGRSNVAFLSFLTRSACPLVALTISSVVPARKLREIVEWVHTLRNMHLAWPEQALPLSVQQILSRRNRTQ
ncbi:hypothetical protein HWV62_23210 [Athelia sp. TMB]|nr:hypothetical protein HWV62_23210 [Athelia sp. TMB]